MSALGTLLYPLQPASGSLNGADVASPVGNRTVDALSHLIGILLEFMDFAPPAQLLVERLEAMRLGRPQPSPFFLPLDSGAVLDLGCISRFSQHPQLMEPHRDFAEGLRQLVL
jgi:hypothetical protein